MTTYATSASQNKPMMTTKRSTQNPVVKNMLKPQSEPPTFAMLKDAGDAFVEHPPHVDPKLKDDENPTKPLAIASGRDFEDMSQDMHRLFEGRETEQNWDKRRKAIIKISRITHGNGPVEYRAPYTFFIKSQLDGILKVVDSLRTNVTTAGLNTLQHIADTLGHGVDFMVDFVAETLITRSCNTSKVKRDPAIATFETIISNATCNKNILHYIVSASEHKDPNARTAASGWLTALLTKNGRHCDQGGVLDLIEKCIKNGLNDAKPQVRTPMRTTYGTYATLWPDRADRLRDSLDLKTQKMLDSNNTVEPAKLSLKQRPSIRDIKAAKKKEMDTQESARPESAHSNRPSIKDIKAAKIREMKAKEVVRPPSAQSNRTSAKDVKTSKRREAGSDDAARPSSAQSTRPSIRENKTARKRDAGAEDNARPPSAQSTQPSTRDVKTARKRDAEAEDVVRPPSAQSNTASRRRDMEAQDTARPLSGHLHASTNERRFHILSSAPMRPQRGFVDLKRVVPKPALGPQQQADVETPAPPQLDDHKLAKQIEKSLCDAKSEALPPSSSKLNASQLAAITTKAVRADIGEKQVQPLVEDTAVLAAVDRQPARPGTSHRRTASDIPAAFAKDEKRIGKPNDSHRSRSPPSRHGRAQVERPVQIYGDQASANQGSSGNVSRATKRRSGEKMNDSKDVVRVSNRTRSISSSNPPTRTHQDKASANQAGPGKVSQVIKRRSEERMNGSKDAAKASNRTRSISSSNPSVRIHEDKASANQIGSGKISQVTKRRSEEIMNNNLKDMTKVSNRKRSISSSNPPIQIHEDKASANQAGPGKVSQVTKRSSGERMNDALKDMAKVPSNRERSISSPSPPTVLREIDQLNQTVEPVKRQENNRQKYISTETAERNRSVSPHTRNPDKARKQLSRAVEKIRARTMDDYGYRRLQGLIKAHDTLFQDEQKYDELLLALLDTLETPNTERRQPLGRQFNNKFQILVTIRLMLVHSARYCAAYHPRALSALITARRNFEARCHIVGGLEETAEDIVAACSPVDVIDPILDVLELQEYDEAGYRATSMGLQILSGLVARIKGSEIADKTQEQRLTRYALKCLRNENSETRRATIAFCVELRRLINPEERYFQMVAGNDEALKSLLTYFIATNRRK